MKFDCVLLISFKKYEYLYGLYVENIIIFVSYFFNDIYVILKNWYSSSNQIRKDPLTKIKETIREHIVITSLLRLILN
jgi:hypothetical protein